MALAWSNALHQRLRAENQNNLLANTAGSFNVKLRRQRKNISMSRGHARPKHTMPAINPFNLAKASAQQLSAAVRPRAMAPQRWLLLAALVAAGCSAAANASPAAQAVQSYLQARVDANTDMLSTLSCKDWEAEAVAEGESFSGLKAKLEQAACKETATADGFTIVSCTGKIATTYNGEVREWPLEARNFRVQAQAGEWLVCGYAAK